MKITSQMAFDTIVRHLFSMKLPSRVLLGKFKECAYRGEEGAKCAIGCLIPDSAYRPEMEGKPIGTLMRESDVLNELLGNVPLSLLNSLQAVHDSQDSWNEEGLNRGDVTSQLIEIAKAHHLNMGVLAE